MITDKTILNTIIDKALKKHREKVKEYKEGKHGYIGLFLGEVMKQTEGEADPKLTTELIKQKLSL